MKYLTANHSLTNIKPEKVVYDNPILVYLGNQRLIGYANFDGENVTFDINPKSLLDTKGYKPYDEKLLGDKSNWHFYGFIKKYNKGVVEEFQVGNVVIYPQ